MKVIVYGLGIIGASICAALKNAGHTVLGKNRSRKPIDYAVAHGYIDGEAETFAGADVVFLALPPRVVMQVADGENFPDNCIVADICGVKEPIERAVYSKPRNFRYVGAHPMAGKETTGIESASPTLFSGANIVLTRCPKTDEEAFAAVRALACDMKFGRIVVCGAKEHDRMVALTSQLAHVVSNAYVKSPLTGGCVGFTGGSFQDMTRIAPLDEYVWTELFFLNGGNLKRELKRLTDRLGEYLAALEKGDEEKMRALLREGKNAYSEFSEAK